MNDIPQANGKTQRRVEKIAKYVIQFVAVVTALHIGRMWIDYAWYWYFVISIGIPRRPRSLYAWHCKNFCRVLDRQIGDDAANLA